MAQAATVQVRGDGGRDEIELPNGATARRVGRGLELYDANDRLVVRWTGDSAEIAAPAGDLVLSAPSGRVRLRSASDVSIEAGRDVVHHAQRRVELRAGSGERAALSIEQQATRVSCDRLEVDARTSRVVTVEATVVARAITTTAAHVATRAGHVELEATRLVERVRDAYRDVADLAQTRVGRVRTIVREVYALYARRSVMVSKEDTSIDGEKILLG